MKFFDYLKNIFFVLLFLQIAPILIEGIKKQYDKYWEPKTKVGVVTIKGTLYDSGTHSKNLEQLFKDPSIKAILIRMECPGSAAGTGQSIHNELRALKKEYLKPVVVLVENSCASGGYYIASAADHIIAPGMAIIGSIGIYLPYLFQLRELAQQYKVGYKSIKSGQFKATGDPLLDMTEEEAKMLQSMLDDSYQQFVTDVAHNRNLVVADAPQWANGRMFSGNQALKLGLIDELGSAYNAIKVIKDKALIEGDIEWVHTPKEHGLRALLSGDQSSDSDESLFVSSMNRLCTYLENRYNTAKAML